MNKRMYDVSDPSDQVLHATKLAQNGPRRHVRCLEELDGWVRSRAYNDTIAYISSTSMAIQGIKLNSDYPVSKQMLRLCEIFDGLEILLAECTPKFDSSDTLLESQQTSARAYRTWTRQMQQFVFSILDEALQPECKHINELGQYLRRSFGCSSSLEFGPANELMFLFFLCSLFRAGILVAEDTVAAALLLFHRYIRLIRRLILTYSLSLTKNSRSSMDDYYVMPYIWGAAQLSLDAPFSPMQSELPLTIETHGQEYMFLEIIDHLQKTRGFQINHSAFQLWCILSAPTWPQVYGGIERSYVSNVLASFETVENAIFCELMSFKSVPAFTMEQRAYLGRRFSEDRKSSMRSQGEMPVAVHKSVSQQPSLFFGFHENKSTDGESDDEEHVPLWIVQRRNTLEDNSDTSTAVYFRDAKIIKDYLPPPSSSEQTS
ncbi:serine/threonine-protein phosphatase 2A activator [Drosophila guanche]|uniref:Serine/threonine-protein phosphatase 2A activator n=1 Tax=Drosophila guanche TaxID=7266 RepID=A0A3B0JNI8_DROGU|nr:serine/threonine-protein phosphatase 2A activator [Drosophila guanche]SPP82463.1 blast:Serine/threonine-protein phosphatase 2A activator [Drosophila guanche]